MNGEDFVKLAGSLVAGAAADESRFRTAVSRAYYGAFHIAVRVLGEVGFQVKANHAEHREAIDTLASTGIALAVEAGRIIDDLHSSRIVADYRLNKNTFSKRENAKLIVEDAYNATVSLNKCLEEPTRTELIEFFSDDEGKP